MTPTSLIATTIFAFALAFTGPVLAQDSTSGQAETPEAFATMAAQANMLEIQSSQMAMERAQSDAVRRFAEHMVEDHTAMAEQLRQAAQETGISNLPQSLDSEHQQILDELKSVSDDSFDSQYMQMQVTAHEKAVTLAENFARKDGPMAYLAEQSMPTLQEHLSQAQEIARQ